ncbi:MAG: DUF5106 domain-containing protein [Bacteroidales bacterium]|nr:DUF5106 domain-containing protein [Bacteroidales bacterium]
MKKIILTLIYATGSFFSFSQGHNIEVNILNLKKQDVIIGHYFNEQLIPDDTITLNTKGIGVFKGKEAYPTGMYFLFLPNKNKFDFILDKDQDFIIIADTTNFLETVSFKKSEENLIFMDYQKHMRKASKEQEDLMKKREEFKADKNKVKEIDGQMKQIREDMNKYHNKVVSENSGLFFIKFLIATRRPEVPKTITDKKEQYFWFRHHYFDNFDVSDPGLLRTPIYESTIETYIDKVLMQHPDTLIPEVDILIEKSKTNKELFRFMMVYLFNKYASSQVMTAENVYVHIAEKYYIKEAEWSDTKFISDLKNKIANKKKCLIGNQAYNINYNLAPFDTLKINALLDEEENYKSKGLQIEKSEADSIIKYNLKVGLLQDYLTKFEETYALKDVTAEYTIIWFWTPSCSHCREETPKFHEMYIEKGMKEKNVKVIAMYMQKDLTDWKKHTKDIKDWLEFIKKHNLNDWVNAWNPFDSFRKNYDITSSPVLYLLDKDKKIIAKKIGYEQAFDIIESETKK